MKFRKKHTIRNWMSVVFSIKVNYEIGSFIPELFILLEKEQSKGQNDSF